MAATPQKVLDIAPEFASVEEARIQTFLDYAALSINATVWGVKADFAQALLAAHYLTMSGRAGIGGAVQMEKVGDLSRTYFGEAGTETLGDTSYGRWYLELRKSVVTSPVCL